MHCTAAALVKVLTGGGWHGFLGLMSAGRTNQRGFQNHGMHMRFTGDFRVEMRAVSMGARNTRPYNASPIDQTPSRTSTAPVMRGIRAANRAIVFNNRRPRRVSTASTSGLDNASPKMNRDTPP